MKTKASDQNVDRRDFLRLITVGLPLLVISLLLSWYSDSEQAVEQYYAKGFYPLFSFVTKSLFEWVPFSIGDVVYIAVSIYSIFLLFSVLVALKNKSLKSATLRLLQLGIFLLTLYVYFYISWGQNYYRVPLQKQLSLNIQAITQDEYLEVVNRYIDSLNIIRGQVDIEKQSSTQAESDIQRLMFASGEQLPMLSRTQVKVKHPISSHLISFFTITGYFNPFTHEVHVNQLMPKTSYPFTVAHELSHQMGIGLEDECNFVAFLMLHDSPNLWYRYAAYYETVQYLLRPLYFQNKEKYEYYVRRMSDTVRGDYLADQKFWRGYLGWVSTFSERFYSGYLRHNNQPEGSTRYTLMGRLVVAWENQLK